MWETPLLLATLKWDFYVLVSKVNLDTGSCIPLLTGSCCVGMQNCWVLPSASNFVLAWKTSWPCCTYLSMHMTPINKYRVNLSTSFFKLLKPPVIVISTILCHRVCVCVCVHEKSAGICTDMHSWLTFFPSCVWVRAS